MTTSASPFLLQAFPAAAVLRCFWDDSEWILLQFICVYKLRQDQRSRISATQIGALSPFLCVSNEPKEGQFILLLTGASRMRLNLIMIPTPDSAAFRRCFAQNSTAAFPSAKTSAVCFAQKRWLVLVLGALSFAGGTVLAVTPPFETLITQDASTGQGLTEFPSSAGLLNLQMEAVNVLSDPNGSAMPTNPQLGDPTQQFVYPRLAFYCQDSTHQVTSFGGPLLRVRPGDRIHIQFTNESVDAADQSALSRVGCALRMRETAGTFGDFVGLHSVCRPSTPATPGPTTLPSR